jgi:metal-responsive CopG/Arc/MetJ family transcriptional regulator
MRAAIGPDVHVKLPASMIETIDDLAKWSGVSRSEAIRRLLELACGQWTMQRYALSGPITGTAGTLP